MTARRRDPMPTIKDVAKQAGVSVTTVSRVLNRSGYFDDETGRKVRDAVEALGYRRNVHWARLGRNSSQTVCFVLGNRRSMNSMQMRVLMACEEALHAGGYDLVFTRHSYSAAERDPALPRMLDLEGVADGVVLAGLHHANFLRRLEGRGLPFVVLGNNVTASPDALRHDAVFYDDEAALFDAARYLIRLGHRRTAFVGNIAHPWFHRRWQGFRRAMRGRKKGEIDVVGDWQVSNLEYGRLAAADLLRREEPPTAILAANDEIAAGVWKELTHRGVAIPRRMSLIGFGDREEFSMLEPSLTSATVFPEQLGATLARMLLEKFARPGARPASVTLPCRIVERSSCGPPPARLASTG
ncbi:MAG: LacI family DNA-binding transcriptional regulator [Dehalococcoidia bacterium]|nr:LacI family DNA-binding transcriptional regulator [Dehalococcoidia bacterium]